MPKRQANQTPPQKKTPAAVRREIRTALQEVEKQLVNIRKLKEMEYRLRKLGLRWATEYFAHTLHY